MKRLFEEHGDLVCMLMGLLVILAIIYFSSIKVDAGGHYGLRAGANVQLMKALDMADKITAKRHKRERERQAKLKAKAKEHDNKLKAIFGYAPSDDEITLMLRVAMAECGNTEPMDGIERVIEVIANRVKSGRFPDTITEVAYQRYQFETVTTGAIWRYEINDKVKQAWENILNHGYCNDTQVLFFTAGGYNPYCEPAYKIGHHYFGY